LYIVAIKIDETLPWIELKGEFKTKKEARKAVRELLKNVKTKIIEIPEKRQAIKAVASIKTR
jgi:hypothetical protein